MARRPANPFYVPLVFCGLLFTLSACGYFVMALRAERRGPEALQAEPNRLMLFMDHFGAWLLTGEVTLLAVATVATIGTDGYWTRRQAAREAAGSQRSNPCEVTPS